MARDLSLPRESLERRIGADWAGRRLDEFMIAWIKWRTRDDVLERIANRRVAVEGRIADGARLLRIGDRVVLTVDPPPRWDLDLDAHPLVFLHEEESFLVLDKPAGAVVHPVGKFVSNTLMNALFARFKRPDGTLSATPMVVHRLDRQTSGVLVVAKNDSARRALGAAFEDRAVKKEYLALVRGVVAKDSFEIALPLGPDDSGRNRTLQRVRDDGKPARTKFAVVRRFAGATLVACEPVTGRTHQIRLHLAAAGHAIFCDPLYGPDSDPNVPSNIPPATAAALGASHLAAEEVLLTRLALHAARLEFPHPTTGRKIAFESPLAPDLAAAVRRLDPSAP